ncbi:MAG TPA: hypothetical protein VJ716_04575 [Gaiellaceae bacterium]|nr:hypothetical protein [Gaiellaceae bacterium]
MSDGFGLGKASLELEAELTRFEREMGAAGRSVEGLDRKLDALITISEVAQRALNDVGLDPGQAAKSRLSAEGILEGVKGIGEESRAAALELDRVKLSETQAAETEASGGVIRHVLDAISRDADQAKRKLAEVRLAGGRNGVGVGPIGSGYGRVGVLGSAVAVGALTAPVAAPAALGLLGAIPVLAGGAAGAIGTLALAFDGVGKAISGNKQAFDALSPAAQRFVQTVRSLDGWLDKLRAIAARSLFPGLTAGLRAALSPGTVNAITTAVGELGRALGAAGAAWGRYFGSHEFESIFGPVMASAARNIGVLSDAFLHLFDALGVLARAAIPFTNWLTSAIDRGSKLADSWLHAKDASGALAHAMGEAEKSLALIGHLAGAAVGVIGALGKALLPVANVAVKALTDGLHALGSAIQAATPALRSSLTAALQTVASVAKLIGPTLGTLVSGSLQLIAKELRAFAPVVRDLEPLFAALDGAVRGILPALAAMNVAILKNLEPGFRALVSAATPLVKLIGTGIAGALGILKPILAAAAQGLSGAAQALSFVVRGFTHLLDKIGVHGKVLSVALIGALAVIFPEGAAIVGALAGVELIRKHWGAIAGFFKALGREIVHALEYAWFAIEKGAIYAALKIVEPFSHLPSFLGGWARKAKDRMQGELDRLHPPNMQWGGYAAKAGAATGAAWKGGFLGGIAGLAKSAFDAIGGALHAATHPHKPHHRRPSATTIPDTAIPDPSTSDVFGTPPPFSSTGSGSGSTHHRQHHQTAAQRMQEHLQFALDRAELAVENAKQGSKAYDRAVKAEETALHAEIRYWAKRSHNLDLSLKTRDAAMRKELAYERKLKSLVSGVAKTAAQAAAANEAQFIQTYVDIQNSFGSNVMPVPAPKGKTDTHLYDIKNELRGQTRILKKANEKTRFPHSSAAFERVSAL